jgi:NAD(P)-dependent dehydrogenase (short-subunit alcohol dehydrogenase family)
LDVVNSVLITGASSGLGLETALHLAERGFAVYGGVLAPSDRHALEEPARQRNLKIQVLPLDITQAESVDQAVQRVVEETGGIYALVNNAGTRLRGCFEDLSEAEIRRLFDTNVFGTMTMTRAVIPHMRTARRGRIVMITSVAGKMGSFGLSAYCATKFAQEGFAESLAQELSLWGVQLVILEPGIIKTEAWDVHRVISEGAKNPESPYYSWFQRFEALSDRMVETSSTTGLDVAEAVHKALTAKRPKLRYMVGRRARLVVALRRHMPGEWFERRYFRHVNRMLTKGRTSDTAP